MESWLLRNVGFYRSFLPFYYYYRCQKSWLCRVGFVIYSAKSAHESSCLNWIRSFHFPFFFLFLEKSDCRSFIVLDLDRLPREKCFVTDFILCFGAKLIIISDDLFTDERFLSEWFIFDNFFWPVSSCSQQIIFKYIIWMPRSICPKRET